MTDLERARRIARVYRSTFGEDAENDLAEVIAAALAVSREWERKRVLGLLEEWREAMESVGQLHSLEYMLSEVRGNQCTLIIDQFPVEEEFDAKTCLIEEVAEAFAAVREETLSSSRKEMMREKAVAGLRKEVVELQEALHLVFTREKTMVDHEKQRWLDCALVDATMEGPKLKGWNRSALDRMWRGDR